MKANEILHEMFEQSPLQKEWKPKVGDNTDKGIIHNIKLGRYDADLLHVMDGSVWLFIDQMEIEKNDAVWLPTQEDWQEIYKKNNTEPLRDMLEKFVSFCSCWEEDEPLPRIKNLPDYLDMTILWCLFVHKEVFGLVWDWDKKKWKFAQ